MKMINIYYQAVTKVSLAQLEVEDHEDIEDYIKLWKDQGYCQAHINNNSIFVYIPWPSIVYCQYTS